MNITKKQYNKAVLLATRYNDSEVLSELFNNAVIDNNADKALNIRFNNGLYIVILIDGYSHS